VTDAADRQRTREILDLQEGRGPVPLLDDAGIESLLRSSRRIAVIGASPRPGRPSHDVFAALRARGWDAVPVTPVAEEIAGARAYPTLARAVEQTGPFDIVDVFRRAEACPAHAREAVDAGGTRCLWLQLGVVSWEAARIAAEGGLLVVMDRCSLIEAVRVFGATARSD
jgi:predicted CoA-binding protein